MNEIQNNKKSLRSRYGTLRIGLSGEERLKYMPLLQQKFNELPFNERRIFMLYKPMEHYNEIDPLVLAETFAGSAGVHQYAYPVLQSNFDMDARLVSDKTVWEKNEWNIPEPANGGWIHPDRIDVVIVPLLAFDKQGHRVGFGKGYYDRFLQRCTQRVMTVGLSWFDAVEEIGGITPYDIPLQYCITPHRLYAF